MSEIQIQCAHCPWRVDCDPENDIPDGYSCEAHHKLEGTIADPGVISFGGKMRVMACHESYPGHEKFCVGYLANQLGPGNNIALRLEMIHGNLPKFETVGEQHKHFRDTLPENKQ